MSTRGIKYALNRFGVRAPRLVIHGNDATPVWPPGHIFPSAAPSTTAAAGDFYFDSTKNEVLFSNGVSYAPAGSRVPAKTGAATLTAADNGALCLFNNATGFTYTLPAAEAGLHFTFAVTTTVTSGVARLACASGDFLLGTILQIVDTTYAPTPRDADGSTHLAWEGNGSTTGGIKGDFFSVYAISGTQWAIWGINTATGTEATPFKTT